MALLLPAVRGFANSQRIDAFVQCMTWLAPMARPSPYATVQSLTAVGRLGTNKGKEHRCFEFRCNGRQC